MSSYPLVQIHIQGGIVADIRSDTDIEVQVIDWDITRDLSPACLEDFVTYDAINANDPPPWTDVQLRRHGIEGKPKPEEGL